MRTHALLVLLSFVLSVAALVTPHAAPAHSHRRIAARVNAVEHTHRRRAGSKRCKPRSSSAPAPTPSPSTLNAFIETPKEAPKETPSSTKPAPTTTPKEAPKEAPTPTPAPSPSPSPKPSTGGGIGASIGAFFAGTNNGDGTFYATGLGACGITNNDGDLIAAASHQLFDSFPGYGGGDPNANPMCGRKVRASRNGKSVLVSLTDRCEGCSPADLDFSPAAFNQLADASEGRVKITWAWA